MQSTSSPFVEYAQQKKSPKQVAALLGCSQGTAREGLREAALALSERNDRCENAASLLRHSGLTMPDIARRRWTDLALGIQKAA